MDWGAVAQLGQVLLFPAFGYIIVLERRITRMQTQIENLIEQIRSKP